MTGYRCPNEAHPAARDPDHQRIQRIVRATLGSKPIAEPDEVFLVDRVQHRHGRLLDNLVLQGGDRQVTLSPIRLWNTPPP